MNMIARDKTEMKSRNKTVGPWQESRDKAALWRQVEIWEDKCQIQGSKWSSEEMEYPEVLAFLDSSKIIV